MIGACGYGRYNGDLNHVGCPRAATDMTPCVARDGRTAVADDHTCVGCAQPPTALLAELDRVAGGLTILAPAERGVGPRAGAAADALARRVRHLTEPRQPAGDTP